MVPDLYQQLTPPTLREVRIKERALGLELRDQGYGVWQNWGWAGSLERPSEATQTTLSGLRSPPCPAHHLAERPQIPPLR